MEPKEDKLSKNTQYALNLTLATVAGQVGCLTLVIIFGALVAGMWLDARFDTKPLFTVILLVGSVPVSLISMVKVVLRTTSRIESNSSNGQSSTQEEI